MRPRFAMSSALAVRAPEAPSHGSSRVGAGRYPNTTPGTGEPHAAHRSFDATPLRLVALAHAMRHASGDCRRYRGSWRAAPSIAAAKPVLEPLLRRVCASNVRSKPGGSPPDFGTTPRPRKRPSPHEGKQTALAFLAKEARALADAAPARSTSTGQWAARCTSTRPRILACAG